MPPSQRKSWAGLRTADVPLTSYGSGPEDAVKYVLSELLDGPDGPAMRDAIRLAIQQQRVAAHDETALDEVTLDELLSDPAIAAEILAAFNVEVADLCAARGWPHAAFLLCQCSARCLVALTLTEDGRDTLDELLARVRQAQYPPGTP